MKLDEFHDLTLSLADVEALKDHQFSQSDFMNFDLVDFSVLMHSHVAFEDFLFLFNGDDSIAVVLAFEIDKVKWVNFQVAQRV